jgi:cellulose synthase/poly-beta-1,6-N-acetylglucosamine synthase-like glycosyltransferase
VTEIVFWASVVLLLHPYVTYPLSIALLGALRPRPVRRERHEPLVSVIIPAHNEARWISATVLNKLGQDYPRDRMEILVVSDGSVDGTDERVAAFADRGVRLLRQEPRQGKAEALNRAVREARGEILVFSDANSLFAEDAVRRLVENFADPDVGYVTGRLEYGAREGAVSGEGSRGYMGFENGLRVLETRFHSIIGVNGGVDAMRRELYVDVAANMISDFLLPLEALRRGRRVVFDPRARSSEEANTDLRPEFRMRVRVALRALQALQARRELLAPWKHLRIAYCLWSHKVLRYTNVLLLPLPLVASGLLAAHSAFYGALFLLQAAAYLVGLAGLFPLPSGLRRFASLPAYFLMTSAAFALAMLKFFRGEAMATWQPRSG